MRPDKERPAENTCRIVKGLDAVWAHFCPSKPCLPLSSDGIYIIAHFLLSCIGEIDAYFAQSFSVSPDFSPDSLPCVPF